MAYSRKSRSERPSSRRAARIVLSAVIAIGLVLVLIGTLMMIKSSSTPAVEKSTPVVTSQPSVTPTPTPPPPATPTPTETATPVVATCPNYQFGETTLSIPSVGMNVNVQQYTPEQRIANGGQIIPPEKNDVIWDSWYCYKQGIDSIPSASASTCVYLAGHSYKDGSAIFNKLVDVAVGAEATITVNGETLTYVKTRPEDVILKQTQRSDENLYPSTAQPGCLKLVTCLSEGERDANGHAISLRVATFQLKTDD